MKLLIPCTVALVLAAATIGNSQTVEQLQVKVNQLEGSRALAAKNLGASEQGLAMAKSALAAAQANTKREPVYENVMVRKRVDFADGRERYRDVSERRQTGWRTITDPTVPQKTADVGFYEGQIAQGQRAVADLDRQIADTRAAYNAALSRPAAAAPVAAVATAPAPVVEAAPVVEQPAAEAAPAAAPAVMTVSEPAYKSIWVWIGGIVFLLVALRYVVGRAAE